MRFALALPLVMAASLTLAACGDAGPSADLVIDAKADDFDADDYSVEAGLRTVSYQQKDATFHTLRIERAEGGVLDLNLAVGGGRGDLAEGTVELVAGDYLLFCDVPGHRAEGMEARLVVTAAED